MQLLSGVNRSLLTILAETLETEHAALLGVESIVRADTDVDTRMDVGAALAHKNVAGENELTVSASFPTVSAGCMWPMNTRSTRL